MTQVAKIREGEPADAGRATRASTEPASSLGQSAGIAFAMAAAFAEIEGATKSATNPHFKSKYADLGAVIDAIKPALINHDLFFTQRPEPVADGVQIETVLHHASGEEMSLGKLFVPANKRDAQGFGSALTYARRYALVTAFGVPVEDDDGNAAVKAGPDETKKPAHSKLKSDIRAFVHELEGVGDWDTYVTFRETPDFKRITKECEEKLPEWWEGWPDQPDGFVPLKDRIASAHDRCAAEKASTLQAG